MNSDLENKLNQLSDIETDDFLELAKIAGMNPAKDFVGADLSNVNLEGADLKEFDMSYANLSNANLSNADLSYADLSSCDLSYADLQNCKLIATKFYDADLTGVKWGDSNRSSAKFYGAKSDFPLGGSEAKSSLYTDNVRQADAKYPPISIQEEFSSE